MRVHIAESFLQSLTRLDGPAQRVVKRAAFDFFADPTHPGLRQHRLVHAVDRGFWSLRVDRDLRIIIHRSPAEVALCWADRHDGAYAWAARRTWAAAGRAPAGAGPPRRLEIHGGARRLRPTEWSECA